MARAIHGVQMAAYRQEAELLDARDFPPLHRTVEDIARSAETFLGAYEGPRLAGVLGYSSRAIAPGISIDSLVVLPSHQRRGVGRALVAELLSSHSSREVTVQTGARNAPALALYASFGFAEFERFVLRQHRLELVRLRRAPGHTADAGPLVR